MNEPGAFEPLASTEISSRERADESGGPGGRLYEQLFVSLTKLAAEIAPAQLGIVCARLGLSFADIASPHLPYGERVQRLLSYLSQHPERPQQSLRRGAAQPAHDALEGLFDLGNALLEDEATTELAQAYGLPALVKGSANLLSASIQGFEQGRPLKPLGRPCICQPLPAPPAWLGRDAELGAIEAHLHTGARIVLLRGESGAGKSALLGRWLRELLIVNPPPCPPPWQEAGFDGVFYWSFAHDKDENSFLQAAADYVLGDAASCLDVRRTGEETTGRYHLDRLLNGMARREGAVLFILDGLEELQQRRTPGVSAGLWPAFLGAFSAEGDQRPTPNEQTEVVEGELLALAPDLASLLLSIVLGTVRGAVVATVVTPLALLRPWFGGRAVEVELPPLTPSEGAALLHYSGVTSGDESDIEQRSIEHGGHALTLYLLGRYLHAYFEGDGRAVTRAELPATDTGLHIVDLRDSLDRISLRQVLRAHLLALSESARRLLDLCVLLPGPLRISVLQAMLDQLRQGSGTRAGGGSGAWAVQSAASFRAPTPPAVLLPDPTWIQGPAGLVERLAELEQLGLLHIVPMPNDGDEEAIEIHPLVREPIYREWLMARGGFWLVPCFQAEDPYAYLPRGEQALELLEELVLLLIAAGQPDAAYRLLEQRLGGYLHHVHYLGRARRFLFVVRQLYPAVAGAALSDLVWQRRYARLLTWEAETLRVLGQLEAALVTAQRQWPLGSAPLPRRLLQQARILRSIGRLEQSAALATAARQTVSTACDSVLAAIELANIFLFSGDPAMCQVYLLDASALLRDEAAALLGEAEAAELSLWLQRVYARRAMYLGHHQRARGLLEYCRARAEEHHSELDGAQCDVMLAELLRRERSYDAAGQTLHRALIAAGRSGDVETLISGGRVQGTLRLDTGHLDGAAAAFGPALALASEHGFGCYRIDLLVCRGALSLRRGEAEAAERDVRDALAYATAPGCGYLWGQADALHLLATVLISGRPARTSPRHAEAVAHLSDELELRERMSDPTAPEVRWLLRRLRP